ncbi:MAG: hypothetical protein ACI9LO_001314 [Planctomycetota bacterium]
MLTYKFSLGVEKMKVQKSLLKLSVALTFTGLVGASAYAASEPGTASAELIAPLTISENTPIDFGTLAAGPSASVIAMSSAGTRTLSSGDAELITSDAGNAAIFDVTGAGTSIYAISFSASATVESGSNLMTVNGFSSSIGLTGGLIAGAQSFNVGANLNVGASQPAGTYTTAGSPYTVTVNYN